MRRSTALAPPGRLAVVASPVSWSLPPGSVQGPWGVPCGDMPARSAARTPLHTTIDKDVADTRVSSGVIVGTFFTL